MTIRKVGRVTVFCAFEGKSPWEGKKPMKNIYLIGDSIRLGYDSHARELLSDCAQLYWNQDNARFVQYTTRYIQMWAYEDCDPEKIDIVHFNNGAWDIAHMKDGSRFNTVEEYVAGLKRNIGLLRIVFPNAKLIFATTACVLEERINPGFLRRNCDIEEYNEAAKKLMAEENIPVDDLYPVSLTVPPEYRTEDGVHFTQEGFRMLGVAVADFLRPYCK